MLFFIQSFSMCRVSMQVVLEIIKEPSWIKNLTKKSWLDLNAFFKLKTQENRLAYVRQHKYCVKLLLVEEATVHLNLGTVSSNKFFLKTISP